MSTYLTIVTGTSRGLGAAMAEELLQADSVVLGISRHANQALPARAQSLQVRCDQ